MRTLTTLLALSLATTTYAVENLGSTRLYTMTIDGTEYTHTEGGEFSPVPGAAMLSNISIGNTLYSQIWFSELPALGDTALYEGTHTFSTDEMVYAYITINQSDKEILRLSLDDELLPGEANGRFNGRFLQPGEHHFDVYATGTGPLGGPGIGTRLHTLHVNFIPVPEPSSLVLVGVGCVGVWFRLRSSGRLC